MLKLQVAGRETAQSAKARGLTSDVKVLAFSSVLRNLKRTLRLLTWWAAASKDEGKMDTRDFPKVRPLGILERF